jgi:hypothetical protein
MRMFFRPGWHPYPMARSGGSFLVLLGLGLLIGVLTATNGVINTRPFIIGAVLGLISIPVVRRTWRLGTPTRWQILALILAICLELALFAVLQSVLQSGTTERNRWLWALGIVGVHFIPMYWTFGPRILVLGLLSAATAATGLVSHQAPFALFASADAVLKIGFGIWLFCTPARPLPAGR